MNETTAIRDGAKLLDSEPLAAWKAYMTFHFANSYSTDLPKAFDTAQFDFNLKALRGVEKQRDRWKRGTHAGRRDASAKDSARSTCASTFRPRPRPRWTSWW